MKTAFEKFMSAMVVCILGLCGYGISRLPAPLPTSSGPQKFGAFYPGTLTAAFPNYPYPVMSLTATAQTVTQPLSGASYVTISQTATTCSSATYQFKVSNDGGVTYYALAVAPYVAGTLVPSTSAITVTNNSASLFVANVAGFTNIEVVTSSTFTATGFAIQIVGTSNNGHILNIG